MDYKVGQVFYLVGSETARVIPFMVIEEVARTTLEGVEKSYIAQLPDSDKTRVEVSKLKGEVFDNLNSLRIQMVSNAQSAIEKMIQDAVTISEASYDLPKSPELPELKAQEAFFDNQQPDTSEGSASLDDPAGEFKVIDKDLTLDNPLEASSVQSVENSDIVKVDMGNGVVANMKVNDLDKVAQQ